MCNMTSQHIGYRVAIALGTCATINSAPSTLLSTTRKVWRRPRPEFGPRVSLIVSRVLVDLGPTHGQTQTNSRQVEITMLNVKRAADSAPRLIPELYPVDTGFPAVRNTSDLTQTFDTTDSKNKSRLTAVDSAGRRRATALSSVLTSHLNFSPASE